MSNAVNLLSIGNVAVSTIAAIVAIVAARYAYLGQKQQLKVVVKEDDQEVIYILLSNIPGNIELFGVKYCSQPGIVLEYPIAGPFRIETGEWHRQSIADGEMENIKALLVSQTADFFVRTIDGHIYNAKFSL